jgi:hypothetical protein
MELTKLFAIFIFLTFPWAIVSAQDLVYPNMPYAIIKTNRGPVLITELQYAYGTGDVTVPYSSTFAGFTGLFGYQINRSFLIAAGTGFSKYNGGSLIPLFLDLRYAYLISHFTPYLFGDGGLLLDFSDFNQTKMFINPGIGVRYSVSRKFGINISSGIMLQTAGPTMNAFLNLKTGVTYKF